MTDAHSDQSDLPPLPTNDWVAYGRAMAIRQASRWSSGLRKAIIAALPRDTSFSDRDTLITASRHQAEKDFMAFVFDQGPGDIITRAEALASAVQEDITDDHQPSRLANTISQTPDLLAHSTRHTQLQNLENLRRVAEVKFQSSLQLSIMSRAVMYSSGTAPSASAEIIKEEQNRQKIASDLVKLLEDIRQTPWVWGALTPIVTHRLQEVVTQASQSVAVAEACDEVIMTHQTVSGPSASPAPRHKLGG